MQPTSRNPTPDAARENLSALFDGELHGDTARFALKRMGQELQWRQSLGTWQLAGDVLRGGAMAAAPSDFAERVSATIANDEPALAVVHASNTRRLPRRWMTGAALAASVAVAALFVAGPFDNAVRAPANGPAAPVSQMATTAMSPASPLTTLPAPADDPAATQRGLTAQGATAVVRDQLPRSAAQRRLRTSGRRLASPASAQDERPAIAAVAATADSPVAADSVITGVRPLDPFRASPANIVSRPWPRTVLPVFPTTGAMTASYGSRIGVRNSGGPALQSFYPFDPSLPQAPEPDASASSAEQP